MYSSVLQFQRRPDADGLAAPSAARWEPVGGGGGGGGRAGAEDEADGDGGAAAAVALARRRLRRELEQLERLEQRLWRRHGMERREAGGGGGGAAVR
jgi:hypothetical protein